MVEAVGGGNFLVLAESQPQALAACEAAIEEMRKIPNVIMPFPGGVVRSGSKVGSKYPALDASTNDAFCPTLKGVTKTDLSPEIESVMEIVIDGLSKEDIDQAMRVGIQAVCDLGAANGIKRISAGNYGGKLGPFHFHLQEIHGMSALTFTLNANRISVWICRRWFAKNYRAWTPSQIAAIELQNGKNKIRVDELFDNQRSGYAKISSLPAVLINWILSARNWTAAALPCRAMPALIWRWR